MSRVKDLAHHVEDRVVIQRVADLLKLFEQPLQNATFNGVGRDEVEDEAILPLPVAVDSPHPLFQPHGVPRDVVIHHQPAELKVDALAGGFGRDEHLAGVAVDLELLRIHYQ